MKVLINISVISKNHRGMGIFTKQILFKLLVDKTFDFILVSCCEIDHSLFELIKKKHITYERIQSSLPIFEQFFVPYLIKKYKPDVCWFPSNTFPLYKPKGTKFIATIHDLIFLYEDIKPKNLTQRIGKFYRAFVIKNGVNKLDKVTSVSLAALGEIVDTFHLAKQELSLDNVLYNSVQINDTCDNEILSKLGLIENQYFYTISGSAPSKNLLFLIKSFAIYLLKNEDNTKLVISGIANKDERKEFIALAKSLQIDDRVIFTDFISEYEKNALLKKCQLFIFASKYEGFGIPLIESLYFGCNALVSDIQVFREIGKEYVYYFDNQNNNFLIEYFEKKGRIHFDNSNIRKYIEHTYSLSVTLNKLKKIIREFT